MRHGIRLALAPGIAGLCAVALLAAPAPAEARDDDESRLEQFAGTAFPLSFRSERGGRFEPRRLVVLAPEGTWSAALPATARARSADHLDFSGVPLFGPLFAERLAPEDAERSGRLVGTVSRIGETLILDGRGAGAALTGRPLVLTTDLPQVGAVTFSVGLPDFRPGPAPAAPGTRVGAAYLVGETLVLASDGQRPPITDWSRPFGF